MPETDADLDPKTAALRRAEDMVELAWLALVDQFGLPMAAQVMIAMAENAIGPSIALAMAPTGRPH